MPIYLAKSITGKVCVIRTQGVWKPTEDEPRIILGDKMMIGDNVLESLSSGSFKLLRKIPCNEIVIDDNVYESVRSFYDKLLPESIESECLGWSLSTSGFELLSSGKSIDEMVIGDNVHESTSSFPRKLLQESLESGGLGRSFFKPPEVKRPWEEAHYPPLEKLGGFYGYGLPAPPNMGTGTSGGTLGMQGGLMILMFAVCYLLYMILKKRVCSFSIGWKDTDAGELELGGPRDT